MNSLPLKLNTFRWKGFWKQGVTRSPDGRALFTEEGLLYYVFWSRRFNSNAPVEGMLFDYFVLDFLTVIKLRHLRYCNAVPVKSGCTTLSA